MAKKKRHEEHEEHMDESWLVPYADVLTLLLALFIVLFAMSKIDQEKFEQVAESLSAAFNSTGIMMGETSIVPIIAPPPPPTPPEEKTPDQTKGYDAETAQLNELRMRLNAYINANDLNTQLETQMTEEGLMIVIKDAMFFKSGSADILPASQPIVNSIAEMLTTVSQKIVVSGHTDNLQINTPEFPSNWELSSKRALNFMKAMLAQEPSLDPARFSAIGYGEYRPVADNSNEAGRARNRRVEVMILRDFPRVIPPN